MTKPGAYLCGIRHESISYLFLDEMNAIFHQTPESPWGHQATYVANYLLRCIFTCLDCH